MNDKKIIKIDGIYIFLFILVGGIGYVISLVDELNILANETLIQKIVFVIYLLFGFGLLYALTVTSRIIELNREEVIVHPMFGCMKAKNIKMEKLLKIVQVSNKNGNLIRIVLIFPEKKKIKFYNFQRNFLTANTFLRENYPDEMFEVQ